MLFNLSTFFETPLLPHCDSEVTSKLTEMLKCHKFKSLLKRW